MTQSEKKEAIECIKTQLENGYVDTGGVHYENEVEVIRQAMNALGAIEQYKWERDVAIEQLSELGLSLWQKVDHVIIKDEIIEYLLDMLEEEHMGMRSVATKDIKDKFGVDV